jgi:hypothetical protein
MASHEDSWLFQEEEEPYNHKVIHMQVKVVKWVEAVVEVEV